MPSAKLANTRLCSIEALERFVWSERGFNAIYRHLRAFSPSVDDDHNLNSRLLTAKTIRARLQMASQSPPSLYDS
jgi:hypothetical protein